MKLTARDLCHSVVLLLAVLALPAQAQFEGPSLGSGPWVIQSFEQDYVKASIIARGLDHPFGLAFLPGSVTANNPLGDLLISERTGKLRLLSNGQLQPDAVVDLAKVLPMEQLFDLKLHPQFARNGLVYFTYIKTAPNPDGSKDYWVTTALGRGRFTGTAFTEVEDVFVAEAWSNNIGGASSRLHFLPDGTLLFGVSHRIDEEAPQKLDNHIGKILRLKDDGSAPADNPYFAVEGALPEMFTLGNRSVMDFTTHPVTGAVWEIENGPQGGDEVNILKPATNFGWPVATYGRDYDGTRFSPQPWVEGTELPELFWVPSITVAGLTFYSGDKFPKWKHNLFVTSMIVGRIPGTGHIVRVVLNENGEVRREELFKNLKQRFRYIQQGPDQLLYALTDHSDGVLLRIEPATAAEFEAATAAGAGSAVTQQVERGGLNDTELFANQDCRTCHRMRDALVGPAYNAVANRYAMTDANIALLAGKIIEGSEGVWGETPMAPHPAIARDTAEQMVRAILGLTKQ